MKPLYKSSNDPHNSLDHVQKLSEALSILENAAEVQKFLEDLCTPAELQAMADRWRVVDLIESSKPYRQIYEETGVSMTTIGRVARCLRFGTGGYQLARTRTTLEQLNNEINP
jgi:TrpR-related protein YerC/YecD